MKAPILERLQTLRHNSGLSFESLHDITGYSTSTLCRWFKGEGSPSVDDITALAEAMGGHVEDIFVAVGQQEMTVTQSIGYPGAVAMQEHYESRLSAANEKLAMLQSHHEQAIQTQRDTYDRSVLYLKEQLREERKSRSSLQDQLSALNQSVLESNRRRNLAFSVMFCFLVLLFVGFVITLFSNSIV